MKDLGPKQSLYAGPNCHVVKGGGCNMSERVGSIIQFNHPARLARERLLPHQDECTSWVCALPCAEADVRAERDRMGLCGVP